MRPIPVWLRVAIAVAGAFGLMVFLLPGLLASATGSRLRQVAAARGLTASWTSMRGGFPMSLSITQLAFTDSAGGGAPFTAESLSIAIDPLSVLVLRPRLLEARLAHARFVRGSRAAADPDTLPPEETEGATAPGTQERLKRSAESFVQVLLLPARRLPNLTLEDVRIESAPDADALGRGIAIDRLAVTPWRGGVRARASGVLDLRESVPFVATVDWAHDDRLVGAARFEVPAPGDTTEPLSITIDGAVTQDRHAGVVRIADSTRVNIGHLPFSLGGTLSRRGPRLELTLSADDLTAEAWRESLPRTLLGPLQNLGVRGSYDQRVSLDLDLDNPDSVQFEARVIPHGLQLDASRTKLAIFGLEEPFTATIHLPHGRFAVRELGPGNVHYRPLEGISAALVHAVVTNEDGAFYRHRGFNPEAIRGAIADNLRAGRYRRGAGTITMQLARNLYLGHERTLSRKAQEVVLTWVLEHLTGLPKDRMLEIYLNIIEWGPGVHGADEAARYYFDTDASALTVDQALFLATVVPAPTKWRYRFDADGSLRPFERAQMHFIGRAMIKKGWLAPEDLPPAESLRVELRGPARMEIEGAAPAQSAATQSGPAS